MLTYYLLRINDNFSRVLSPSKTTVTVYGNYNEGEISDFREVFRQWNTFISPENTGQTVMPDTIAAKPACYLVHYPSEKNYQVLFVAAQIDKKDYLSKVKLDFVKYLSTDMSNRLFDIDLKSNDNFGKVKSGYFEDNKQVLYYYTTSINENNFILSLKEFENLVLQSNVSKIDKKEFKLYKNAFLSSDHLVYEKNSSKAFLVNRSVANDIPSDYFAKKAKLIKKVKAPSLKAYADGEASKSKGFMVIVGNISKIVNDINSAGYKPVIETDRNGFFLNN